ncbi:MAG: hypothetical protein K0A98_07245 [Trueperaceae bacterium]|nr:hypothetical protein [Trueperaceae bacterium]
MEYACELVERQAEPTLVVRRRVAVEIGFAFERPLAELRTRVVLPVR